MIETDDRESRNIVTENSPELRLGYKILNGMRNGRRKMVTYESRKNGGPRVLVDAVVSVVVQTVEAADSLRKDKRKDPGTIVAIKKGIAANRQGVQSELADLKLGIEIVETAMRGEDVYSIAAGMDAYRVLEALWLTWTSTNSLAAARTKKTVQHVREAIIRSILSEEQDSHRHLFSSVYGS